MGPHWPPVNSWTFLHTSRCVARIVELDVEEFHTIDLHLQIWQMPYHMTSSYWTVEELHTTGLPLQIWQMPCHMTSSYWTVPHCSSRKGPLPLVPRSKNGRKMIFLTWVQEFLLFTSWRHLTAMLWLNSDWQTQSTPTAVLGEPYYLFLITFDFSHDNFLQNLLDFFHIVFSNCFCRPS